MLTHNNMAMQRRCYSVLPSLKLHEVDDYKILHTHTFIHTLLIMCMRIDKCNDYYYRCINCNDKNIQPI